MTQQKQSRRSDKRTHPGGGVEDAFAKEESGEPGIEEGEGDTEQHGVVEGVVDKVHRKGSEGVAEAGRGGDAGGEPFGEGAKVGAEEGVGGIDNAVVGPEAAAGDAHQPCPNPQRVHRVRPGPRHPSSLSLSLSPLRACVPLPPPLPRCRRPRWPWL